MKTIETLRKIFWSTLSTISFANRYKDISENFNESDYEKLEKKTNKNEIISIFKDLGYTVKYFPGGDFVIQETVQSFNFKLIFIVKNGIITNYINIFYENEKINTQFNFGFIFRELVNNPDAKITTPKFKDYKDFKEISENILSIYSDLKTTFLNDVSA